MQPSSSMPMPSAGSNKPARDRAVFINCPFDPKYRPLFRAMCFTILACGYVPRSALDYSDSGEVRFQKIVEIMSECGLSIHDLSRVELDKGSGLPRFNMPLELGADLGLRLKGPKLQRQRRTLILDAVAHRYDKTLSDISGQDIEAHGNKVEQIVGRVRDWLNANRGETPPLPGAKALYDDYKGYLKLVPDIARQFRLDEHSALAHVDYLYTVEMALPLIEAARSR